MPTCVVKSNRRAAWYGRAGVVLAFAVLVVGSPAACGRGGRPGRDSAAATGDAGAVEVDALNYEVTADRYRRWVAAQGALDALPGLPEPPRLDPARFTDADVARAVRYLESDARARTALARANISARDYVLTTLALDQALVATSAGTNARTATGPGVASGSRGAAAGAASSAPAKTPSVGGAGGAEPARTAAAPRTRTRYRNLPPQNSELVERNREDIARVRQGMRFRIVKERVDTVEAAGAVDVSAAQMASNRVIPAGTPLTVRLDSRVCTNAQKAGDRVTGTVTAPVSGMNGAQIPAGATASLSVVGPRGNPSAGGPMEFTLNSITIGGRTYSVGGTAVASRVDRVRVSSGNKDAQKIVGGAAVGAVAGQVIGKNTKSTVIGAAVGAAAGAAAAEATARYDACVPAGSPIQVTLGDALPLHV